jgi:L-iditol 2-dehydrogenase
MKVAGLTDHGLEVVERPPTEPRAGEIVVRLAACGVCGTDLEKLRGNYRSAGKIGHEPVGIVRAIGTGVDGVAPGDRVFVHHHVACGNCLVCRRGDPTFCPTYARTNLEPGGFSEEFVVPAENVRAGAVLPLSGSVDWDSGALLEPAGCALTALRRVGFRPGDSVFIVGLGPVGLLYARLARTLGASWVGGAELAPARRTAAERGGIDSVVDPRDPEAVAASVHAATEGVGVDLSVVATGAPSAVTLAAGLPRRGGTLNLFGLPGAGTRLEVDLQALYLHGTRVIPTYATTEREIAEVHGLVAGGRLTVRDLVTDRYPVGEIAAAFERAGRPDLGVKVVVTGPAFP